MPAAFSLACCFILHAPWILTVHRDRKLENIYKEVLDYEEL